MHAKADSVHLGWERRITYHVHVVAKECNLGLTKGIFIWADDEPMGIQLFKDGAEMLQVLLWSGAAGKNIIHFHSYVYKESTPQMVINDLQEVEVGRPYEIYLC